MPAIRTTLLLSALLSFTAAASAQDAAAPQTDATPAASAPAAAPAASGDVGGLVPPPPEGKGQIVFFREKKFAGAGVRYKVREGETELGKLTSGSYFIVPVTPGAHEYVVHSEAKDVFNIEVEAGETYYVIGTVTMGFMAGHPNLSPSDRATFESMSKKLKRAD